MRKRKHKLRHSDTLPLDPKRCFDKKQKAILFQRSGGLCECCGEKVRGPWTAGHIKAHSLGGRTDISNGRVECNTGCSQGTHKEDTGRVAKARRQACETGQQARRARNGSRLQSRGFDTTLTKRMNGDVVTRKQRRKKR